MRLTFTCGNTVVGRFTAALVIAALLSAWQQESSSGFETASRWENPEIVGIGKEPAYATHFPYSSRHEALALRNEDLYYQPGAQRHAADIELRDETTLNIDWAQMGVGGDNSWGAIAHEQYMIKPQDIAWSFWIMPVKSDQDSGEVARYLETTIESRN